MVFKATPKIGVGYKMFCAKRFQRISVMRDPPDAPIEGSCARYGEGAGRKSIGGIKNGNGEKTWKVLMECQGLRDQKLA